MENSKAQPCHLKTAAPSFPGVGALAEWAGVGPVARVQALVADEAAPVPELLRAEGAVQQVAAAAALAVLVLVPVAVALAAGGAEEEEEEEMTS